jgi:transcriptional regulator with XRE-family HTH domain
MSSPDLDPGPDPQRFSSLTSVPPPVEPGMHRHLLVSERLRLRRRQLGLTQQEVAARLRRLGVDTTNKALSSLERGAGVDVCKLPELARALECTLTYLVGLTDDPLSWEPAEGDWPTAGSARNALPAAPQVAPPDGSDRPDGPWILGPVSPFHSRSD